MMRPFPWVRPVTIAEGLVAVAPIRLGNHTPNAAALARLKIQRFLDVVGQRNRRLDHFAVKIEDVKGTLGADRQANGSKPVIR